MHRLTDPNSGRKAPIGLLLLLALAVAAVGQSMAGETLAVDRWKHPPARAGAGQFRALRMGPNAFRPNTFGPSSRAEPVAGPEQRREGVGNQVEGRPLELNRPTLNPAERGPELQRQEANPAGRAPADLQRQQANTGARRPAELQRPGTNPVARGPADLPRQEANTGARRPAELQRPGANPAARTPADLPRQEANTGARSPAELQRPGANPAARGPADLQRQAPGSTTQNAAQRGPLQNGQAAAGFARRALAERALQGPGRFGQGPLAGRFQPRPFAGGLIVRRPMIGERNFTGVPPIGETRFLTNEMVFHVPANVSPQAVDTVARRLGLSTVASQSFNLSGGTLFHFRITDGRPVADVVRALESENIGVAQPNYVYRLQQDATLAARSTGGDPSQYVVDKLRLVDVHRIAIGSNVLVAVIDSQIDGKHPELAGAVADEFDAVGNHDKAHVHGTGMAGAIAAHRRLIGIAPGVRLLAIHAFSSSATDSAEATSAHILMGIDWAIKKGAKIINMSFAGPDDPMLQLALQKAHDKGVVLIGAAGNMGPKSPPLYPAADPNVIAVTATDAKDQLLAQANQGSYVAVAAPGVDILEPAPNGGYQVTTGTSVAAAHVSGIVALLLDHDPTLDAAAIRDILTSSAKHHAPKGRDDQFGWGVVDPYRALMAADTKMAQDRSKMPATTEGAATPRPISAR